MPAIPARARNITQELAEERTRTAAELNTSTQLKVDQLEREVKYLALICEGMWQLLKDKQDYTDIELIAKVTELDLTDGKLDGRKATVKPKQCPKCTRIMMRYRPVCVYCGETILPALFE